MNPLDRVKQRAQPTPSGSSLVQRVPEASTHSYYEGLVEEARATLAVLDKISEKNQIKKMYLPRVLPFVEEYIQSQASYPNPVAVEVMIWLFDTGDIPRGLRIGAHLVAQGQRMPDRFDANLETFITKQVYDWANTRLAGNLPASDELDYLIGQMELGPWEMHALVKSMAYAMGAKHAEREQCYERAVDYCRKAQQVNPQGHGVKTLLDRCLKALKKSLETPSPLKESESSFQPVSFAIEDGDGAIYFGVTHMNIRKGYQRLVTALPHTALGANGRVENPQWTSSDPRIAGVQLQADDPCKAVVIGLTEGTATIQFEADGAIGEAVLTITADLEVTVSPADSVTVDLEVGDEQPAA